MKNIFIALWECVKFFFGLVKPLCEQALEHPLFKALAFPAAVAAAIAGLWKFLKWIANN